MKKIKNFLKYFWIIPTDLNGSWKFQLTIPIGRKEKYGEINNDNNSNKP